MSITPSQSYSSSFGDTFVLDVSIAGVSALAGDCILAAYSYSLTDNPISALPTWNGQTFSLVHSTSDAEKGVQIYRLIAAASATAPVQLSAEWYTRPCAQIRVFTGNIDGANPIITPVRSFEDGTTLPWSAPNNTLTGVTANDLVVDFLFASDHDSSGLDIPGQTLTPGSGQANSQRVENAVQYKVGNIVSSTKAGAAGSVTTSFSAPSQPIYNYVTLGIKAAAASASISNINSGTGVAAGSSGNSITVTGLGTLTGLTLKDTANNTLTISSFVSQGGGAYTFSVPAITAGSVGIMLGSVTATATDGTLTTSGFATSYSLSGFTGVVAASLDSGAIGSGWTPALAVGDMVAVDSTGSITTGMVYSSSTSGTHPGWHYSNTDKTWRSFSFVNSLAAAIATVVGQAMSFVAGVASAIGSAVAAPLGSAYSFLAGTASANGGSTGTANPVGSSYSFVSGTATGKGGAVATVIGQVYSFLGGAQGQAAASSTAINNGDVRKVNYANLISRQFGLGTIIADLQQRVTALENK